MSPNNNCSNCSLCAQPTAIKTQMKCSGCLHVLHYSCGGLTEDEFHKIWPMNKAKWKCQARKQKTKHTNTAHNEVNTSISSPHPLTDSMLSDLSLPMNTKTFIDYMDKNFSSLREEWRNDVSQTLKPIQKYIQNLSERLYTWENRLEALEEKANVFVELQNENHELKKELQQVQKHFDKMDQNSRYCNLEIQNIPESNGENLVGLVCEIGSLVGVKVPAESIESIYRVAPSIHRGPRPRNIIVQLSTRRLRDAVLEGARARRDLTTEQLSLPAPTRRFYINEHLTLKNKLLYSKARSIRESKDYKHVWVRNATIQMRKTDTSKIIKIRDEQDLDKLI